MEGFKVSELEYILGVSRQAIYDKLKQDKYKAYVHKIKGIKVVSNEGVKALKQEYGIESLCKDIKDEECIAINSECEKNQECKADSMEYCKESKAFKFELQENQVLIKELKDRIKYLENENTTLISLLNQQNSLMQQQNNLIQNEQQITLNHTELLLLEKKDVLKLRKEQYEKYQNNKGVKGIIKRWLGII